VGNGIVFYKLLVLANQYLSQYITIVTEMLYLLFGTQIVKAIARKSGLVVLFLSVFVDGIKTIFGKFERNSSWQLKALSPGTPLVVMKQLPHLLFGVGAGCNHEKMSFSIFE
jgi:hypothetical protein